MTGMNARISDIKYFSVLARMAGLEPATAALTVRGSTIELHPNDGGGSRIRTDVTPFARLFALWRGRDGG